MKLDRLLLQFFPSHDIHTQYSSHWAPFKYVISRHCSAPTFQMHPTPQSLSNGRLVKVLTFLPSCVNFLHDLSSLRTMVTLSLSPRPDWSMEMSHTPQFQSLITGFCSACIVHLASIWCSVQPSFRSLFKYFWVQLPGSFSLKLHLLLAFLVPICFVLHSSYHLPKSDYITLPSWHRQ